MMFKPYKGIVFKRICVGLLLMPIWIPMMLLSEFMEFFHFKVSDKILSFTRSFWRRYYEFLYSIGAYK